MQLRFRSILFLLLSILDLKKDWKPYIYFFQILSEGCDDCYNLYMLFEPVFNPSAVMLWIRDANLWIPLTCLFTTRKETLFYNTDPPFLLPTPPHLRLPSVPISAEAWWRPKIPADVTSSSLPVYRAAYENRRQGGQGRYSTDLPNGNQKRAIVHLVHHKVHIQYLLHSTGCC